MKLRSFAFGGLAVFVTLSIALVLPTLGQGSRGRFGERGSNPSSRLQELLDLTESQVASFESLMESRQPQQMTLFEEIRSARATLRALTDEGVDPAGIGNAMLELRRLEEELQASREQLRSDFKNLLTTDQREKLEDLEELGGGRLLGPIGPGRGGPRAGGGPWSGGRR